MGVDKWTKIALKEVIEKTAETLRENGFNAVVVDDGHKAKEMVFQMLPKGAKVLATTSKTTEALNIAREIAESGNYHDVHKEVLSQDRKSPEGERKMRILRATPDWIVGSAHAITQDGYILVASRTGSQISAYSYGAERIILVVGAQKIVRNVQEGQKRIFEHSLPLESKRAHEAYGVEKSRVNNILTIFGQDNPERIAVILVPEVLGF